MNNELKEYRANNGKKLIWASFFVTSAELCLMPWLQLTIGIYFFSIYGNLTKIYASVSPFNLNRAKSWQDKMNEYMYNLKGPKKLTSLLPRRLGRHRCQRKCWWLWPTRPVQAGSGLCQLKQKLKSSSDHQQAISDLLATWLGSSSPVVSPLWFGLELFFSEKLFFLSGSGSGC